MTTARLGWLVKQRVLLCESYGSIDDGAYRHYMAEIAQVLDANPNPLHIIFDVSATTSLPGLKTQRASAGHPQLGWVIRVGKHPLTLPFISTIVLTATNKSFRFADSVEAATQILRRVDLPLAQAQWTPVAHVRWYETGTTLLAATPLGTS